MPSCASPAISLLQVTSDSSTGSSFFFVFCFLPIKVRAMPLAWTRIFHAFGHPSPHSAFSVQMCLKKKEKKLLRQCHSWYQNSLALSHPTPFIFRRGGAEPGSAFLLILCEALQHQDASQSIGILAYPHITYSDLRAQSWKQPLGAQPGQGARIFARRVRNHRIHAWRCWLPLWSFMGIARVRCTH